MVKEYVEMDFFGENKIVPVYQYACYISTYELDAVGESTNSIPPVNFVMRERPIKTCFELASEEAKSANRNLD